MAIYLKKFETQSAYEAAQSGLILPNVSLTVDNNTVHYNPSSPTPVETRLVAKFNVTNTSSSTQIGYRQYTSGFSEIEIDGVVQTAVTSAYTFSTTGEHTVKYTLIDPTRIGDYAFGGCSGLTSIDIPSGVTTIGGSVFHNCKSLTSIDIPSGVTSIDYGAFYYCSGLTSIVIPNSVTSIGDDAFAYCSSLTSVTIPNSVTSIGEDFFRNCSGLTSVTIPNSVTSIGGMAFRDCTSLKSIVCNAATAPTIQNTTFYNIKTKGKLYVPIGSSGYDVWMGTGDYYLGWYRWTKVEQ